jgi:hypothetical protein
MDAKPTTYRKTVFRSRLEARWAVFLDHFANCTHWAYQPLTVVLKEKGWTYLPDFICTLGPYRFFLEIKPLAPQPDYLFYARQFQQRMKHPLLIGYGGFYNACPLLITNLDPKHNKPLTASPWFRGCEQALRTAQGFRFDITGQDAPPPHKQGSPEQLKSEIRTWVKMERRNNRKPKGRK